jgi:DNA modification methylase
LTGVDAVVTDPPYGICFDYLSHNDSPEGYILWLWRAIEIAESKCSPSSPIFVWQSATNIRLLTKFFPREWRLFIAAKNFVQMRPTPMQWCYDPVLVWWTAGEKPWSAGTATRDFHIANTAPVVASPDNLEKKHPCPRPLDQVQHIVTQWCRPESIVLDLFMGSGTTGVACIRTGRRFIGVEIEPKYCQIAVERMERELSQPCLPTMEPERAKQEVLI